MTELLPSVNPDGTPGPGGWVRIDSVWGDDALVDRIARVSTDTDGAPREMTQVERLVRYLMRHEHSSPFEFPMVRLEARVPIFIARQWFRSRTWSYSETSGRYVELPADVYVPDVFRGQAKTNRQSSAPSDAVDQQLAFEAYVHSVATAQDAYARLLAAGVAREQARGVLPLATMTHFYGAVDLRNLLHFLALRLAPGAQQEFRLFAEAILEGIRPHFPVTIAAWERYILHTRRVRREEVEAFWRAGQAGEILNAGLAEWTDDTATEIAEFAEWMA